MSSTAAPIERTRAFRSMIERELSWTFDVGQFDDRLRMQKLIYLAGEFGLNHGYSYDMYLHGPYSPELASDYYKEEFSEPLEEPQVSSTFDLASFLDLVEDKDVKWMEISATIHSLYESYSETHGGETLDDRVIAATSEKKDVPRSEVDNIYRELNSRGVV